MFNMLNAFNISELRNKWQYHLDNANQEIPNLNTELNNLLPPRIRRDVQREFHSYLYTSTNELTTREALIELLNEMEKTPIIPNEIRYNENANKEFYEQEWRNLATLTIQNILRRIY